jgi:phage/plasmid-associated DNA primase
LEASRQSMEHIRVSNEARDLRAFLQSAEVVECITGKKSDLTNIIDQATGVTYAMPPRLVDTLCDRLEACRRAGIPTSLSERQSTPAVPAGGLMIDFDLVVGRSDAALSDRQAYKIAARILTCIQRGVEYPDGAEVHVFFTVKPGTVPLLSPKGAAVGPPLYRYGFHVLVPGERLVRGYKRLLIRELRADAAVRAILAEVAAPDPAAPDRAEISAAVTAVLGDTVDEGSARVPVLFPGCAKLGKPPYTLLTAFEATMSPYEAPMLRPIPAADLEAMNVVRELVLATPCGDAAIVRRVERQLRPAVADEAREYAARTTDDILSEEELADTDRSLSILAVNDAEAAYLRRLLDILPDEYAEQYHLWRNVIFALAHTSRNYKPLAVYFSQRCPAKWAGGSASLDQVWESAVVGQHTRKGMITKRSLVRWAMEANPARFEELSTMSYLRILERHVYDNTGVIDHFQAAEVLSAILDTKFVVDVDLAAPSRATQYVWYEFVLPGQDCRVGEVWKWRQEAEPDELSIFISTKMTRIYQDLREDLERKMAAADNEAKALFYKATLKAFTASMKKLYNNNFKRGVLAEAHLKFRRRGFIDSLDTVEHVIGVGNGVLELGTPCKLIDRYHEYPVMRFTPAHWRRFDPDAPVTRALLNAIADIIPEPDARDYMLFLCASSLAGGVKEGILTIWQGSGCNGKTFFMRMVAKALGQYAKKLNISILTSDRESADKPNSAIMQLKGARFGYIEETNKAEVMNTQRLKEIVNPGEVSGRELRKTQENFEVTANVMAGLNYDFLVQTTDHGTWRRIKSYKSRVTFKPDPDPANPFEKKDDQRFVREYPNDPEWQSAMLSVLSHYYERLHAEYGGLIKNVPCATIERETEIYRNSQDTINRFLTERIVISPSRTAGCPLTHLSSAYNEWHRKNIGTSTSNIDASTTMQDFLNSGLAKYLQLSANRTTVLKGCRILTDDNIELEEGESYYGLGAEFANDDVVRPLLQPSRRDWWYRAGGADIEDIVMAARAARAADALASLGDDSALRRA